MNPPNQSIIDALNNITLHILHIYIEGRDPPVNQAQRLCILLHLLLDLVQCIYIEGR